VTPHYHADDPRSAGNIDKYYKSALETYKDIMYEALHEYLLGRLKLSYANHPRNQLKKAGAPPKEAEVRDVLAVHQ
jgi:hypothetical protein